MLYSPLAQPAKGAGVGEPIAWQELEPLGEDCPDGQAVHALAALPE